MAIRAPDGAKKKRVGKEGSQKNEKKIMLDIFRKVEEKNGISPL